jgi:bacterioferritin
MSVKIDKNASLYYTLHTVGEELVAERIAIDSYREMIHYLGNDDATTRRMMEGILAMEEEHADDLVSLLEELGT